MGKKIFKKTISEKITPLVQTKLVKQLQRLLPGVSTTTLGRGRGENHQSENIKTLIQVCLEIVFLKPQNKNNDLAR